MAESLLIVKSKAFALEIIKVCNEIKRTKKESVLTNQLIRSGTSVGAKIFVKLFMLIAERILSRGFKSRLRNAAKVSIGLSCLSRVAIMKTKALLKCVLNSNGSSSPLSTPQSKMRSKTKG